jgi:hypothetical protein
VVQLAFRRQFGRRGPHETSIRRWYEQFRYIGCICHQVLQNNPTIYTHPVHQNDHFIVMLSQTLLHVSAYQRHHQRAHTILTKRLAKHHNKVTILMHFWFSMKIYIPKCLVQSLSTEPELHVVYECGTWSLTLWEERRLVFEDQVWTVG